ncbi:hypothetical protein PVAND_003477 [Polypedilum vanderplanki]|uniref:Sulfotransferase domain-containing protein n=1 Tax=Polypedilum vanderplanki TaxID=319348 RepID=A0A9J6BV76_POLVA|nr:hypothetical protein PVAND_003477 [Polypedilum vanderplanki]
MTSNNNKNENEFPYEIKEADGDMKEQFIRDFQGQPTGYVQVGAEKWLLPDKFMHCAKDIYNFEARSDDVWICTYPRSGTTWTQEMIWLICNDLDYETARKITLNERFPFFEFHLYMHDQMKAKFLDENNYEPMKAELIETLAQPGYKFFTEMKQQRFIKTHLPFKLLPKSIAEKRAKVVYVARNPKDVVVSYYHLNKLYRTQGYVNDFQTFFKYFINDLLHWSPFIEHIKDGWSHRHDENVLFLFYEDLISDLRGSLIKLADFLGKPLKDEDLPKLLDHLHIKNFKNNPSINCQNLVDVKILANNAASFIRNGSTAKNSEMTVEMIQEIDEWINDKLRDSDFRFRG